MRILACKAAPFCKALVCCCCFNLPRQQPQLIVEVPAPNQPARSENLRGQLGDASKKMTSAPRFLAISAFSGHRSRVSFRFRSLLAKTLKKFRTELPGGRSQCESEHEALIYIYIYARLVIALPYGSCSGISALALLRYPIS